MQAQGRVLVEGRIIAWCAGTMAAGPVFVIAHFNTGLAMFAYGAIFLMIILAPFAILVGAIPLAGTVYGGGWLGARRRIFRHPLLWGLIGIVAGAAIAPAIDWIVPSPTRAAMVTGLIVALIARRFVTWIDPIAPAPPGI